MTYKALITKNSAKGLLQGDPNTGTLRFSVDGGQTWSTVSSSTFIGITDLSYLNGIWTVTYSDATTEEINVGVDNFLANVAFDSGTNIMTFTMVDSSHIDVNMGDLVASKANKITATENTILIADTLGDLKATSKVFGDTTFNTTPNVSTIPNESSVSAYIANAVLPYVTEADLAATLGDFATDAEVSSGYVAKVAGKGLSTEDYTTTEKTKLSTIAEGAEVNVNADWNATSGDAQILNKPTIPDAQIQADWNQTTDTAKDYIKNKPTIPAAQVQPDWNATSGMGQILNKPTIPSKTSDLTNDSGFTTTSAVASGYVAKDGSKVLSDNNYDSNSKSKLDNLANITTVGTGLSLNSGTLAATGAGGASVPPGCILPFATSGDVPDGFIELECDKTVSRSTYSTLFSAIGTKYGKGNGSTTFGLPDANLTLGKAVTSNVLPVAKYSASLALLSDGRVLAVGGYGSSGVVASCHIGTISGDTITWVETNALPVALYASTVATLSDGRVIVVGGGNASLNSVNTIYFGTVSGNTITWTLSASTYPSVIRQQGSLLLDDGRLACFGGYVTSSNTNAVKIGTISGTTVTWATGTSLPAAWRDMRLTRISSDTFLLAGGLTTAATVGVYFGTVSGNTITWTSGTSLPAARMVGAFATLKDGSVLYLGGCTSTTVTSGTTTIYRGRVFKDAKEVVWELVGHLPDAIGYTDCVVSSVNSLIIAGLANASGASDTTIILPISIQGIKT